MKPALAFFALLLVCCVVAPDPNVLQADPEESAKEAFKRRPFSDKVDWEEAPLTVRAALRGDAKAKESIELAGLSYVPLLVKAGVPESIAWSREILAAHIDWISDRQRWERALLRPDAGITRALYGELKDRFRDSGPQLARAILHAWRLGDREAMNSLIELEPSSKWVKAARGYAAENLNEKESVELMLPVFDDVRHAIEQELFIQRDFLSPETFDLKANSDEGQLLEVSAFLRPDGLPQLREVPAEWSECGLAERIGALAAQANDKDFVASVSDKISVYCGAGFEADRRFVAFARVAFEASARKSPDAIDCESYAMYSSGPMLGVWTRRIANEDWPIERALAAIGAFNSAPDIEASQRICLKECLAYPDALTGLLAMRAVLALRDDRLDGYRNTALALAASQKWSRRAEVYRKALAASGNEALLSLSKSMTGQVPPPAGNGSLGLSLQQRAALLQPFVHENENRAHGGVIGVYWLNMGHMLEGRGALTTASTCLAEATIEAARVSGREQANANTLEWQWFTERHFPAAARPALVNQLSKRFPRLAAIAAAESKLSTDEKANAADRIFYTARKAEADNKPMDDEQLKLLFSDPARSGAGIGLQLAGTSYWRRGSRNLWLLEERIAQLTSPTTFNVCSNLGGYAETIGVNTLGNWELRTQCALQCALLDPCNPQSLFAACSIVLITGTPGVAAGAMLEFASRRALHIALGSIRVRDFGMFFNIAVPASHWLIAATSAWGEEISEKVKQYVVLGILGSRWLNRTWDWFKSISDVSLRPEFARRSGNYLLTRYNGQDVNNILNLSLGFGRLFPEAALKLIQRSEEIGVSDYGRFVGSQNFIRAKASSGEVDAAFKRYKEMRPKRVGNPPYLDRFLLAGLTEGNQHTRIGEALKIMSDYDLETDNSSFAYLYRRALMASGKYKDAFEASLPASQPDNAHTNVKEFSELFHESRHYLNLEDFNALKASAKPYLDRKPNAAIGVYLDALVLAALADKELENGAIKLTPNGRLFWLGTESLDRFGQADCLLDAKALEVLCGRRDWNQLPQSGDLVFWHASRYAERPGVANGNGFMSTAECQARDPYLRGMLAYLCGHRADARVFLEACIAKDQRCSHEFHVAQWLLENRLKPSEDEK